MYFIMNSKLVFHVPFSYIRICFMNSIKQLKHCLVYAICKINHFVHDLDTNIALGFTWCYTSISTMYLLLYFIYSTHGGTLTNMYSVVFVYMQYTVGIVIDIINIASCDRLHRCMLYQIKFT